MQISKEPHLPQQVPLKSLLKETVMNSSTVSPIPPIATPEVPQELEWLLDPKPKRYHVLATAWLTETNGEEVPCTLNYGEFDTIKEAQAQIKDLQAADEVHPYFGNNEVHYSIKDIYPPQDEDIKEMFPEWNFLDSVPEQNRLPAETLIASTELAR